MPTVFIPDNGCFFGVQNYDQAATVYPPFWPAVEHNVIWLLVFTFIATPLGMLFAVIIDARHPRQPRLPDRPVPAGHAVAGAHRDHLGVHLLA